MVRRSFRIGLRLGLLIGAAVALARTMQSRRTASAVPPPAPWEPIVDTPRPEPSAAPVVPAPAAAVVDEAVAVVDEVGEPIEEPAAPPPPAPDPVLDVIPEPEPEPEPAPEPPHEVEAPVKKVAAKKLPAAKKAAPAKKAPAAKKAQKKAAAAPLPGFVEPEGGVCPPTHPVKAKLASRLFHLPGMFAYDRTRADRCYLDAPTAVADGFTQAKR